MQSTDPDGKAAWKCAASGGEKVALQMKFNLMIMLYATVCWSVPVKPENQKLKEIINNILLYMGWSLCPVLATVRFFPLRGWFWCEEREREGARERGGEEGKGEKKAQQVLWGAGEQARAAAADQLDAEKADTSILHTRAHAHSLLSPFCRLYLFALIIKQGDHGSVLVSFAFSLAVGVGVVVGFLQDWLLVRRLPPPPPKNK